VHFSPCSVRCRLKSRPKWITRRPCMRIELFIHIGWQRGRSTHTFHIWPAYKSMHLSSRFCVAFVPPRAMSFAVQSSTGFENDGFTRRSSEIDGKSSNLTSDHAKTPRCLSARRLAAAMFSLPDLWNARNFDIFRRLTSPPTGTDSSLTMELVKGTIERSWSDPEAHFVCSELAIDIWVGTSVDKV